MANNRSSKQSAASRATTRQRTSRPLPAPQTGEAMEEQFRLVFEAAPTGFVVINEGGVVELVNSAFEKLFGYRREELLGKPVELLVPRRFRDNHPGHRTGFFADPRCAANGHRTGPGRAAQGR